MTIYRQDIDGLRAIAVLSVLVFHAFPQALPGGFIGVDIFFVISGYLISNILIQDLANQQLSLRDFYARRIKRIFPALLTILIGCFTVGFILLTPAEFKQLNQLILGGSTFSSNFILLKQSGYFDNAAETKPLMHLWSLAIEEQFYILWPILLIWAYKLRGKMGTLFISLLILSVSLYLNISAISDNPIQTFYHPKTRFWELLIGSTLAIAACFIKTSGKTPQLIKDITAGAGIALILCGIFLIKPTNQFPGYWALIPTIGTALLIISGPNTVISSNLLSNKYLVFIGLISYPLYLWHWPLLSFARIFNNGIPTTEVLWALISLSFLLATGTYYFIEKPIRYGLKNWQHKIQYLCILMLATASAGFLSKSFRGLPERFNVPELQINDGQFNCKNSIEEMCLLGNISSQKTILMYGDSHVGYLTKALASETNDYKIIFFNEGDCFFSHSPIRTNRCLNMRQQLIKLKHENIFAVIRNQRWHALGMKDEASIKSALEDAAKASHLNPKKVIILSTTPDVDVSCHFANYYISARNQSCKQHFESIHHVRTFIEVSQALKMPLNVHLIHPYQIICPNGLCSVIEGNTSNYYDGNHLSLDGAKKITPHILKILKEK